MASIVKLGDGKQPPRAIDVVIHREEATTRHRIRLGVVTHDQARQAKGMIEALAAGVQLNQPPSPEVLAWLGGLSSKLHGRIARCGLCEPRAVKTPVPTLKAFLDAYIEGRSGLKPSTIISLKQTATRLERFFGSDKRIDAITLGAADDYREWLIGKYATATVGRDIKKCRQFFTAGVRKKLVDENPFASVSAPAQVNKSRDHFVSQEIADKVIAHCPEGQWKLIVALSRYGGLRCPSEHLALTWDCVDWERQRLRVNSPKTEHHEGGDHRVIPLFPELRPYLEAEFNAAEPGTLHVISRYRDANANLRTQLLRILAAAEVTPWPRLFHAMRASRQTELVGRHPTHVVCDWMGNSIDVAGKHYLQVTGDDFAAALNGAQQKAQQHALAPERTVGNGGQSGEAKHQENVVFPTFSLVDAASEIGRAGLEPATKGL